VIVGAKHNAAVQACTAQHTVSLAYNERKARSFFLVHFLVAIGKILLLAVVQHRMFQFT